jgi:hypothetical protein
MCPSIADEFARKAAAANRTIRPVRMSLPYLSVWSATKIAFVAGVAVALLSILETMLLWLFLIQSGIFDQAVVPFINGISASGSASVVDAFGFGPVFAFAVIVGVLNLLLIAILGMMLALLYNLSARVTGGIRLGFEIR